ncbi:MAG TPA: hypothetical protein VH413_06795 [Verrucomicrobiae bacterium]|nr:hypothetical protein [Verrucomicrobiae bacterium]
MNPKIALNHILSGSLILAIFYRLRGHDILTGVALVLPLLYVITHVVITLNHRLRGSSSSGGGSPPPTPPSLTPPSRPTGTPPEIYCEHTA